MPDTPAQRPRVVDTAFWCWVTAAVLIAALGMLTLSQGGAPLVIVTGVLLLAAGLAQGYLAGRARRGEARFASAGVGLAMASVAFMALLLLLGAGIAVIAIVGVSMILLITGALLLRREPVRDWFGATS
jgi:uncharacterized membrane protein YjjP (DUF1212 family)